MRSHTVSGGISFTIPPLSYPPPPTGRQTGKVFSLSEAVAQTSCHNLIAPSFVLGSGRMVNLKVNYGLVGNQGFFENKWLREKTKENWILPGRTFNEAGPIGYKFKPCHHRIDKGGRLIPGFPIFLGGGGDQVCGKDAGICWAYTRWEVKFLMKPVLGYF